MDTGSLKASENVELILKHLPSKSFCIVCWKRHCLRLATRKQEVIQQFQFLYFIDMANQADTHSYVAS